MGLEFDAAAEGLVISGVVRSGASDKAGVKPGDRVVKVNGEDVEELDFRGAVAKIVAAEWPKTLQFRRAEEVVQDDPEVRLSCWLLWSCCLRLWVRLCVYLHDRSDLDSAKSTRERIAAEMRAMMGS